MIYFALYWIVEVVLNFILFCRISDNINIVDLKAISVSFSRISPSVSREVKHNNISEPVQTFNLVENLIDVKYAMKNATQPSWIIFLAEKIMIISWKGIMFCWEKKTMKNIEILKYYTVDADSS